MNLTNKNDKKTRTSGVASLFGRGSASKIGKSQFSRSMGGIMERLKGLSRKDLAMVGVGLSVLVAAPVAEYMMSAPADSANMLTSGFSSRESASGMASLYEPGINALSQGSADGAGEVITPLSARDPSSLILGAQPEQPPIDYSSMTGSVGSDSPDSSSSSNAPDMDDMRDSMRDAARNGASEAVKSAGAPTVIPPMGAGLRSLGMFADGGSSSVSGNGKSPITTPSKGKNLSPKQSQMVNPVASAGYKGVANTPKSGSKSGIEQLRAQGDAQGGYFSGAKAIEALDNANSVKISGKPGDGPGEGFGGGGFGHGDGYKGPQKGDHHNSHKHSGKCDTLACKAAEARQQKALEWEFFWKYDLPKDIAKTFINALTKEASDWLVGKIFKKKGGPSEYVCLAAQSKDVVPLCRKDNLVEVARTKDEETYKSWKTGGGDQCPCGKPPASEWNSSGENSNNGSSNEYLIPAEGTFALLVSSYDEGLRRYMAKLSESGRKYRSNSIKDSAEAARESLDMYTDIGNKEASLGFGAPFNKIYDTVRAEGKTLDNDLDVLRSTLTSLTVRFNAADQSGKDFLKKLEDVKNNPNDYIKKDSATNIMVDATENENNPVTKAIQAAYDDFKHQYDLVITVPKQEELLESHKLAIELLKKYNQEAAGDNGGINEEVWGEYRVIASTINYSYKDQLSTKAIKDAKREEIKNRVLTYLENVDSSPEKPTDNNSKTSKEYKNAPSDHTRAAAKARIWRGLPWNLEDTKKEKDMIEIYKEKAAEVKENEIKNWIADSPRLEDENHPSHPLRDIKDLRTLSGKSKSTMLESMEKDGKQFYAPGYRVIVEIRRTYDLEKDALEYIEGQIESLKRLEESIKNSLKVEFNIDLNGGDQGGGNNGGNGGDQGGGNNGGNGGDQGGGNNGGNGGDQGSGILSGLDFSVCKKPNHCTREEIQKLEREASKSKKYSDSNKKEHPVWNEYMNPIKGMDQVDSAHWQDYNNAAGKVHELRNEYDALTALYKNIAPDTEANRKAREDIKKRLDAIPGEAKQARDEADEAWRKVCLDGVEQRKLTVSKNYCETYGKGGTTNHNNTNTVVKPGTSSKPSSSSNPSASAKPAKKTTLPGTLHIAKLKDKGAIVHARDANGKEFKVDVCHGLAIPDAGWFESDCWSYASIRNGTKQCKNIKDGSVQRSCYNIRSSATSNWTDRQIEEYGTTVPPKLRKVDGVKRTYTAKLAIEDYTLDYNKGGTSSKAVIEFFKSNETNETGEIIYNATKDYGKVKFHAKMSCKWNPNEGKWRVSSASTRKEEAISSQSFGIKGGAGGSIGPVKVNFEASYAQGRNIYNFGKDEDASVLINKECPPEVK